MISAFVRVLGLKAATFRFGVNLPRILHLLSKRGL